jgi:hypothetical protein
MNRSASMDTRTGRAIPRDSATCTSGRVAPGRSSRRTWSGASCGLKTFAGRAAAGSRARPYPSRAPLQRSIRWSCCIESVFTHASDLPRRRRFLGAEPGRNAVTARVRGGRKVAGQRLARLRRMPICKPSAKPTLVRTQHLPPARAPDLAACRRRRLPSAHAARCHETLP